MEEVHVIRHKCMVEGLSTLDGLAHNAYRIVIDGESYRRKQRPGQSKTNTSPHLTSSRVSYVLPSALPSGGRNSRRSRSRSPR